MARAVASLRGCGARPAAVQTCPIAPRFAAGRG